MSDLRNGYKGKRLPKLHIEHYFSGSYGRLRDSGRLVTCGMLDHYEMKLLTNPVFGFHFRCLVGTALSGCF